MGALGIAVFFVLLQLVSYTACVCGPVCGHKNSCEPKADPADDCCRHGAPRPESDEGHCFHLEPQGELEGRGVDTVDLPSVAVPWVEPPLPPALEPVAFQVDFVGLPSPFHDPPLYLEHRALLL